MEVSLLPAVLLGAIIFALRFGQWNLYLGRRLKAKFFSNADTWIFLIDAKKIRDNNFRLSSRFREGNLEGQQHYPPLFFYMLALIPQKLVKPAVRYGPALEDSFIALVLYVSMMFATDNLVAATLAAVVYLTSPMIFQQTFCLCARPTSILIISLVFVFSLSFSWLNFVVLSILAALTLLQHKFATQVLVFTSLAFLFIGRFDYALAVGVGFIIALAVSRGYYLKVLTAHVNNLRASYLKQFVFSKAENRFRKTAALFVYCPWIIFFAASLVGLWKNLWGNFLCPFVWIITLLVFAVLTNFWKFRIIGEGWRYLGYMAFPLAFWVGYSMQIKPNLLWLYIVFAVAGAAIGYYYTLRLFRRQEKYLISEADTEIFEQISSVPGSTLAAVPREFTYSISYFSGKEYAIRVDLDLKNQATQLAEIIVINKDFVEPSFYEGLKNRGFASKLEKGKWIVFAA